MNTKLGYHSPPRGQQRSSNRLGPAEGTSLIELEVAVTLTARLVQGRGERGDQWRDLARRTRCFRSNHHLGPRICLTAQLPDSMRRAPGRLSTSLQVQLPDFGKARRG